LSVCAHYPLKNLECLLRAFALLSRNSILAEAKLILIGQASTNIVGGIKQQYSINLVSLAEALGIADRVQFTGFITDRELAEWYAKADIFVFPSLFEGFGLPAIEALGMGLPVITTSCAALPETTLGFATYVTEPSDPRELATVISEVASAPWRFRPSPDQVSTIRTQYDCLSIARRYVELTKI
jgi:glycosyltransferase involved in cell wall biosynthesis